jgi:hypothetical protein
MQKVKNINKITETGLIIRFSALYGVAIVLAPLLVKIILYYFYFDYFRCFV